MKLSSRKSPLSCKVLPPRARRPWETEPEKRVSGAFATLRVSRWALGVAGLLLPEAAMAQGMPQLNFSTPLTTSQVVWGALIFFALYFLLSRHGLPLVGSVLEERSAHIGRDLEGARAAKASADAGITEAEGATAKARAEAQSAINAALDEAKKSAAAQSEALNTRLETRLQEAEAQIAQARATAMGALRQVATETATTVITRLTGTAPDAARLSSAVDAAVVARAPR